MLDPGHREAVGRDLDDEARQPVVAVGGRVGHREDRDEVGHRTLADEPLRAGEQVVVAIADRLGADRGHVRAGLRLGQGERDELLPGRQSRDPARLLLGAASQQQGQRAELLDGEDEPGRGAGATELFDRQAQAEQLATEPPVLHGERQGQDVVGRPAAGGGPAGTRRSGRSRRRVARPVRRRCRGRRRGGGPAPRSVDRWAASTRSPPAS